MYNGEPILGKNSTWVKEPLTESEMLRLGSTAGGLKRGITTGTCAAAAAKGAAYMMFDMLVENVTIHTSAGIALKIDVNLEANPQVNPEEATDIKRCFVKKYSGDDPDITAGVLIYAQVELQENFGSERIKIVGGKGVGYVTLPGLACKVGEAAINPVPKKMIKEGVLEVFNELDYVGGAVVTISIPQGEELAKKTYNGKLGIKGGLSILGTEGIVEPMSSKALIDTIKVEMDVRKAAGADYILLTPGNYGAQFLKETYGEDGFYSVKCSNFVGESLDYALEKGFKGLLFVGHIGKLVKVAAGIMNTHSAYADGRMEILASHAALLGGSRELIEQIMNSVTTDAAYDAIKSESLELCLQVVEALVEKIKFHMEERTKGTMVVHVVMFSNKEGLLGCTEGFEQGKMLYFKDRKSI